MDFLGTLSWMNGCIWMVHNRNTYSVYQWQVMCMQVTNVNILCSDWELFETGRAPAVTVSSYQGSTDKADTIAQTGHLHLQSPDTTQHNTANGLTI